MRYIRGLVLGVSILLGGAVCASGQPPLNLEQVLVLAREQAPAVAIARARIAEAEARLAGARVRLQDNPSLDMAAGPRTGGSLDLDIGVAQQFDPRGSRSARIAAAEALVERERALADAAARAALREGAVAFVTLLQREREIALLEAAMNVTRDVLRAASRRYDVGDIALLDVNVARAANARAESDLKTSMGARFAAAGELAAILGLDPSGISATGELNIAASPPPEQLNRLLAARPEFLALEAERREAMAELRLGDAQRRVRLGGAARYEREGGDQIVLGGLTITFPRFNAGQELRLAGEARGRRVEMELAAGRRAAEVRVAAALAAVAQQSTAVQVLEQDALPQRQDNEDLARRSYEAGQISLADWLIFRRELLDTRREYLQKLRDAAVARIELDALAGVLR